MPASAQLIESLRRDVALEHGAILQYIVHASQLRDSSLVDPIKQAAREEMWHLEWLAEALRDRHAEPTLDRAEVFVSASLLASMRADVDAESVALAHYEETLALVDDDEPLRRLIERVMDDERHHRTMFGRHAMRVEAEGESAFEGEARLTPPDLPILGASVEMEYGGILQHLWNRYLRADCEQSEQYFELAVDEMRHLTRMTAYIAGMGAPRVADVPVDRVVFPHSKEEARQLAQTAEKRARDFYVAHVSKATNPDLKADLERAGYGHDYHAVQLPLAD